MEQNHNMLRGISENGGIVFYGVDSTEIVREMERLHKTSAVTTAALDSVTLQIRAAAPQAVCWLSPTVPAMSRAMWSIRSWSCPRGRTAT